MRQRKNARCFATEHRAASARVVTSLMATGRQAGGNALESLGALQEHRAAVCADPGAGLPWTDQANRAPPEGSCRQSCALWAWEGEPFHNSTSSARAQSGTLVPAGRGHQWKRPWDRRVVHYQNDKIPQWQ
jgi:hypothetical protein